MIRPKATKYTHIDTASIKLYVAYYGLTMSEYNIPLINFAICISTS